MVIHFNAAACASNTIINRRSVMNTIADLEGLKAGGRSLIVVLGAVVGLLVMQDALGIGIGIAWAVGQAPFLACSGGSMILSGGHGTGAAWAKVFAERHGLQAGRGTSGLEQPLMLIKISATVI
jgi:sodium--glutamate symport carrier gltS